MKGVHIYHWEGVNQFVEKRIIYSIQDQHIAVNQDKEVLQISW